MFATTTLPGAPTVTAPDGSEVRVLLGVAGGGMAQFRLAAGATSVAVRHRTVEELWYVVAGRGEMWRRLVDDGSVDDTVEEAVVELAPGTCLSIPVGTAFQFRAGGDEPLAVVGATMPPWPGPGEAELVEGLWAPTVPPGPH